MIGKDCLPVSCTIRQQPRRSPGFLLAEAIPAMVASLVMFGAICSLFIAVESGVLGSDLRRRARQTIEASLLRMLSDLRSAGCNPWGISAVQGFVADPYGGEKGASVYVAFDRRGNAVRSFPDGDIHDPDEQVVYTWESDTQVLRRNSQPMALDVVRNQDSRRLFEVTRRGVNVLLCITMTVRPQGPSSEVSLSTKVWLRNPHPP